MSMTPNNLPETPLVVVAILWEPPPGELHPSGTRDCLARGPGGGAETRLIDLRDYRLGFCGSEHENPDGEGVLRLRHEVGLAQGSSSGTPEYHGGFSGVLKNALDLLDPAAIRGKLIGLVSVSGGRWGE